jgi:hypothetical protein
VLKIVEKISGYGAVRGEEATTNEIAANPEAWYTCCPAGIFARISDRLEESHGITICFVRAVWPTLRAPAA